MITSLITKIASVVGDFLCYDAEERSHLKLEKEQWQQIANNQSEEGTNSRIEGR
jgi:hypothetical protein